MSNPSKEWLEKMADAEDGCSVSVGGLACDLGLPVSPDELHLYSRDCPARPGNHPQAGDSAWTLDMILHDGRKLFLHLGRVGRDCIRQILNEEYADE
jgi:hypothetical protein